MVVMFHPDLAVDREDGHRSYPLPFLASDSVENPTNPPIMAAFPIELRVFLRRVRLRGPTSNLQNLARWQVDATLRNGATQRQKIEPPSALIPIAFEAILPSCWPLLYLSDSLLKVNE